MRNAYIDKDNNLRVIDELFLLSYYFNNEMTIYDYVVDVSLMTQTQVPLWFYNMGEND